MIKKFFGKIFVAVFAAIIFVFAAGASGCSFLNRLYDDWLTKDQKEITDEAMGKICSAIEGRDVKAVKAVFSYDDICGVEDFDSQAERLCGYVTGGNISYFRKASGSDGAAMGGYPREREFGGVRYNIKTLTDEYKVCFGYRSHYSEGRNSITKEKIGFIYFDIINVKNDRPDCGERLYGGCPFDYKGINFDYRTNYLFSPEEYDYKAALCDNLENFEPVIINGADALNEFYLENKDNYTLGGREDGEGFSDVAAAYDAEFFVSHSLYVVGMYREGGGVAYIPQFLYIGDFVLADIAAFPYDEHFDEFEGQYTADGVILFFELPEKVPDGIEAVLQMRYVER